MIRERYLISAWADGLLIIGAPALALGLTMVAHAWWRFDADALRRGGSPLDGWVGVLVAAHLALTFVHVASCGSEVRRGPWRFTIVPAMLFAALCALPALRGLAIPIALAWDVYHAGMQSFGLARAYAHRAGEGDATRSLDYAFNHAVLAGPLLAGLGAGLYLRRLGGASIGEVRFLDVLEAPVLEALNPMRPVIVLLAAAAVVAHGLATARRLRSGAPVSRQRLVLLATTSAVTIVSLAWDPFGMAVVTTKLFHCIQYFALVTVSDRHVAHWLAARRLGLPAVALLFCVPALAYGAWARLATVGTASPVAASVVLTTTFLHFWYDGFTWPSRRSPP